MERPVFEAIERVRRLGLCDERDAERVAQALADLGLEAAARWVREHPEWYRQGIEAGFRPVDRLPGRR